MGENTTNTTITEPNMAPDSRSESLYLTHPTPEEKLATWNLNAVNWGAALSLRDYLEREAYLTTVPLAKDGGVTHWILVDRTLPPNERGILASCETLRKPVLVSHNGVITEAITHGIGSVFSQPKFRGKGYASRMLRELGPTLENWQVDQNIPGMQNCPFSILYSDIGKKYYAKFGWVPFPSTHIAFPPATNTKPFATKPLAAADIEELCVLDEQYIRRSLQSAKDGKIHVALIPNYDVMQWHHTREDFVSGKIFGRSPTIKGAIAGEPGSHVWAIWTRAFYGPLKSDSGNTLHILRLVIEDETDIEANAAKLKGILEIAQAEAKEWQLGHVELWNPTEVLKQMVIGTGLEHSEIEREEESITSLMWYGEGSGTSDDIHWFGNEKYGWC
jgi:GNAT superfamily N-acetyltransferase